jgi:2-methylisocitrate lyase-like PEP mutase family enzyme
MPTQTQKAEQFLALHHGEQPLLMPNPWYRGSAALLAAMGFAALATTSSGMAATLGRLDGAVARDDAIAHAAWIAAGTDLPVSADLENCFADEPDGVADTVRLAIAAGLAGCSAEDYAKRADQPIYDPVLAAERVAAAAEAAHAGPVHLVLTARAENYLRGNPDLADTIARLQSYSSAGADVLYAPGVTRPDEIRELVASVDRPVNVLALPGVPTVTELAALGVKRISVGGAFANVALGALAQAARELLEHGTYGYFDLARRGSAVTRNAFTGEPSG